MGRPRHALPSGRRELEHAYRALLAEHAAQRAETAQARLDVTRLLTLTEGLTALVTRLSGELSEARRALDRRPDEGRAEALAAQVVDLRATIVLQQSLLADLTRSVSEALVRVPPTAPPPVAHVVPAMHVDPAAPVVPTAPAEPAPEVVAEVVAEVAALPQAVAPEPAGPQPAVPGEGSTGAGPVEDETVLRLRVIRQAFER